MGRGEGGGCPLEGRSVLAFEGLFVAGIGGSHPLGNGKGGRRDAGRRSRGPGDAATQRSEWQDPCLEPGGYWGDALFANFESGFGCLGSFRSHSTKHAFWSVKPSPWTLSTACDKNVSFFRLVILGHAMARILYTKVSFSSSK